MFGPHIGWTITGYVVIGAGIATQFPNAMAMIRLAIGFAQGLRRYVRWTNYWSPMHLVSAQAFSRWCF